MCGRLLTFEVALGGPLMLEEVRDNLMNNCMLDIDMIEIRDQVHILFTLANE